MKEENILPLQCTGKYTKYIVCEVYQRHFSFTLVDTLDEWPYDCPSSTNEQLSIKIPVFYENW